MTVSEDKSRSELAWYNEGQKRFEEREVAFADIDSAVLASRLIERYLEVLGNDVSEVMVGVSDAYETAKGMGYEIRSRIIVISSEDTDNPEHPFRLGVGGRVFQINRGGGFGEPIVEFELDENVSGVFANRALGDAGKLSLNDKRPYFLLNSEFFSYDITALEHFLPGIGLTRDGWRFMFGEGETDYSFAISELGQNQELIEECFAKIKKKIDIWSESGSASI